MLEPRRVHTTTGAAERIQARSTARSDVGRRRYDRRRISSNDLLEGRRRGQPRLTSLGDDLGVLSGEGAGLRNRDLGAGVASNDEGLARGYGDNGSRLGA